MTQLSTSLTFKGSSYLAAYLLEQGADPRAVGFKWHRDGLTPLELALGEGGPPPARAAPLTTGMRQPAGEPDLTR